MKLKTMAHGDTVGAINTRPELTRQEAGQEQPPVIPEVDHSICQEEGQPAHLQQRHGPEGAPPGLQRRGGGGTLRAERWTEGGQHNPLGRCRAGRAVLGQRLVGNPVSGSNECCASSRTNRQVYTLQDRHFSRPNRQAA